MPELCVPTAAGAEPDHPASKEDSVSAATASECGSSASSSSTVQFSGHSAALLHLAKWCRETEKFTDVVIQCKDGEAKAHR